MSESPQEDALALALARIDLGADVPPALRQAVGAALEWVDGLGRDAMPPQASPRDRVRRLR